VRYSALQYGVYYAVLKRCQGFI